MDKSKGGFQHSTPNPNASGATLERGPRMDPLSKPNLPGKSQSSKQTGNSIDPDQTEAMGAKDSDD